LALAGLSYHQIAKRTAIPNATVKAARTAAQAPALREFTDQLTLDQAAILAEFEDDPEAVETLLDAAQQGRFEHLVQRLRDDREEAAKRAEFTAHLTEQGVTVIERPNHGHPTIAALTRLTDADGNDLSPDNHAHCPGHAAYVGTEWRQPTDTDTVVNDEEDGFEDDDYDEEEDTDNARTWQPPVQVLVACYVCTDYAAHGHRDRWAGSGSQTTKKRAADMTEAERDAAKAERRHVIESNKAWKAATQVRRDWIAGFVQRKTAPAGAEAYLARVMVGGWHFSTPGQDVMALAGFAGRDGSDVWNVAAEQRQSATDAVATASPKRALQIALAVTVALWEHSTHPNTWRNHTRHDLDTLAQLKEWGYPTSEIEDRMIAAAEGQEEATD
jgi:ParB family chromosome partitioning protein